jgi:hypothetical protein
MDWMCNSSTTIRLERTAAIFGDFGFAGMLTDDYKKQQ